MLDKLISKFKNFISPDSNQPSANTAKTYPIQPDVLYLETAYACNLKCVMCPRNIDSGNQGMLSQELFDEILPDLNMFKGVHISGWGEPLMSPLMPEIIRKVKECGCHAAFPTNGLLLKGQLARDILNAKPDHINVSIDACCAETYESVRGKGTFEALIKTLRDFIPLRAKESPSTFLGWVFVMMRSNFRELPGAVKLAIELGFDRFIAKHMESALSTEGLSEALFNTGYVTPPQPELFAEVEAVLEEARALAEGKIQLEVHPFQYAIDGMCLARPVNNLFLDYLGNLSPCCYLTVIDTRPYMCKKSPDNGVVGNVSNSSISEIIQSPKYVKFQKDWVEGRIPPVCQGCIQLARMREQPNSSSTSLRSKAGSR